MAGSETRPLAEVLAAKSAVYISARSGEAALRGNTLVLDGEARLALGSIRRVVLIGRANASPALLYGLIKAGIPVDWLDLFGRPLGLLMPMDEGMDASQASQSAFCASNRALELARRLILAKVDNGYEVLRRRVAEPKALRRLRPEIASAQSAASLRGFEGAAAREYFSEWHGIVHKFRWQGRKPHPAPDPVNMLLSTGYGLLRNRLASALRHSGLNPRLGFLHEGRGRHAALASDLMEPLRALVDARVLLMTRHPALQPGAFAVRFGRCVCADKKAFPLILGDFEDMFASRHKFYVDPEDNSAILERTVNDIIDDLAESFAWHVHDGQGCIIPRLAPCAAA